MARRILLPLLIILVNITGCYFWGPLTQSGGSQEAIVPTRPAVTEVVPATLDTTPTSAEPSEPINLANLEIELSLIASGFSRPIGLTHAGNGSQRLFVVEKAGRIRI